MQLYDQFNRPIAPRKKPSRRPLAVAPIYDSWREYVTTGMTPERLARIFRDADAGDVRRQAELYDQIEERDGHLIGERGKRMNAVRDVAFNLEPASDDARDVRVCEFAESVLNDMADWADVLVSLQDAVGKGFSALEIKWDLSEGQAVPATLEFIEQRRFQFYGQDGLLRRYPLLITDENPMGVEIPAWQLIFHLYGGKSGHPVRSGVYKVCAWMWLFKNFAIKDWVAFAEVYGMPLRLGKYDTAASETDRDALFNAVRSIGSDAAGVISKSTEIEFVETLKTSTGELYENLTDFCNREMSKAILGHAQSADSQASGSYASDKVKEEVRQDLVKADTFALAATVRHQLLRPLVGYNFGWETAVPKYAPDWEEADDLEAKANWVTALLDRGVQMPVSFVRKEFSIPDPENGVEMIGVQTSDSPTGLSQKMRENLSGAAKYIAKKAPPEQPDLYAPVEAVVKKTAAEAPTDGYAEPVEALVKSADSLEDLKEKVLALDLPTDEMGDHMARALALAHLMGRYDADQR